MEWKLTQGGLRSMERDSEGRILCFWCKKPMKVLRSRDREYAWCHGQAVVCSKEDLLKLKEYWEKFNA